MRRALSIALILIVVFAAALLAGFWGAARLAPERVAAGGGAAAEPGAPRPGHARQPRDRPGAAGSPGSGWRRAAPARCSKDDVTLLAGRGPRPPRPALARARPARPRRPPARGRHRDVPARTTTASLRATTSRRILHPIQVAGEFLREHPCGIPDLEVEGLTVLVTRDHQLDVLFEGGTGALACEGLGRDHAQAPARRHRAARRRDVPGLVHARGQPTTPRPPTSCSRACRSRRCSG